MALRDKFAGRIQPHLPEGETYKTAFPGQAGPNPMWSLVSSLIVLFMTKMRVVVVTDKAVHVYQASSWSTAKPKKHVATLPLGTKIRREDKKLWGSLNIGGERIWVHGRFSGDVLTANRMSTELAAVAA